MPFYKRPGVYVEETLAAVQAPTGTSLSAAAFVGPVNRGPLSVATVESWNEFTRLYGSFSGPSDYLPLAVFDFFANGGRRAHVLRATSATGVVASTLTLNDRAAVTPVPTLRVDAFSPGTWGNQTYIQVVDRLVRPEGGGAAVFTGRFDIVVRYGGTTDAFIVERWNDLSMDQADARYAPSVVNNTESGSYYIALTDLNSATASPNDAPAALAATALAGGANGGALDAARLSALLTDLDVIEEPFGLNYPGESSAAVVNAAVTYASGRGDVFVVADSASARTPAQVVTDAQGLVNSSYGAVYYPWVYKTDPSSRAANAVRLAPPGGSILGLYAQFDTQNGVFRAPAGITARIGGALGIERKLSNSDLDTLNENHVNAIRQMPGTGVVVMGARTLRQGYSDRYVPIRRTLIYIKTSLMASTRFAIFQPNDQVLWRSLEDITGQILTDLWRQGGLRGATPDEAFYVKCDEELNTPTTISQGYVYVEVGVALQYPAEFVVIRIGQFESGASAEEV